MNAKCQYAVPDGINGYNCIGGQLNGRNVSKGVCEACLTGAIKPARELTEEEKVRMRASMEALRAARPMSSSPLSLAETVERVRVSMDVAARASEGTVQERLADCTACEFLSGTVCRKCGCSTPRKIASASSSCPEGRWEMNQEPQAGTGCTSCRGL